MAKERRKISTSFKNCCTWDRLVNNEIHSPRHLNYRIYIFFLLEEYFHTLLFQLPSYELRYETLKEKFDICFQEWNLDSFNVKMSV